MPGIHHADSSISNTLNSNRTLGIQLIRIPLMALLLAILETLALVVFKHAMFAAVVALAEAAVADNGLGAVLAVLEGAADFLGGHAAAQGQCEVQCCVWADGVVG
jgi:hypothetical protein